MRGDEFFRGLGKKTTDSAVFSTQHGDLRGAAASTETQIADGKNIRIGLEKKGRGGKTVSVIHGLPMSTDALQALCTTLKKKCGTGGSVVGVSIEIQGDHRANLREALLAAGFAAKLSGG